MRSTCGSSHLSGSIIRREAIFGILAGEFRAHLAQEGQLAFVVEQQIVTHRALHPPDTHRSRAGARYRR